MKAIQSKLKRDLGESRKAHKETEVLLSCQQYFTQRVEFKPAIISDTYLEKLKKKYKPLNKGFNKKLSKSKMTESSTTQPNNPHTHFHDDIPTPRQILCDPSKIQLGWAEIKGIGGGLGNMGNTCFLNSVLQCLTYTPPLVNYLYSGEHRKSCNIQGYCAMCELSSHITRTYNSRGKVIRPVTIVQNLQYVAKHFRPGRQEDAHEFLRYFVEALQKACLHGYPPKMDPYSKNTTVMHQIFGGYHRSEVQCIECVKTSNTFDPLLDISLDIKGCSTLVRALEKSTKPDLLDGENRYACPFCKKLTKAQKRLTIHRPPNVLTIHLKRFDYNSVFGGKINKHVDYKEHLNIRPFMSDKEGPAVWYSLCSVLVHLGFSCHSGHYFCFVKSSNNSWYSLNDSQVQQVSQMTVLNQEAYLLFYKKDHNYSEKCDYNLSGNQPKGKSHRQSQRDKLSLSLVKFPLKPTGVVNPSPQTISAPSPPLLSPKSSLSTPMSPSSNQAPPPPPPPLLSPQHSSVNKIVYKKGQPPPPPGLPPPPPGAPPLPPSAPPLPPPPGIPPQPPSTVPVIPQTPPISVTDSITNTDETFELRKSDVPFKPHPVATPTISSTTIPDRPVQPKAPAFTPRSVSFTKKPKTSKQTIETLREGKHPPVAMVSPHQHMTQKPVARVPPSPQIKNNENDFPQKFEGSGGIITEKVSDKDNELTSANNIPIRFGPSLPTVTTPSQGLGPRNEKVTVVFKQSMKTNRMSTTVQSESESAAEEEVREPPVYEVKHFEHKRKKHRKHHCHDNEKKHDRKRKHRHRDDTPTSSSDDSNHDDRQHASKRRKESKHTKRRYRHHSPPTGSDSDYSSDYGHRRHRDNRSPDMSHGKSKTRKHRTSSSPEATRRKELSLTHRVTEIPWESTKKSNYSKLAEKTSKSGLSDLFEERHNDVRTWEGEKSTLEYLEKEEESRRRGRDDWDKEYDRGKVKKTKKHDDGHWEDSNPFQDYYKGHKNNHPRRDSYSKNRHNRRK